MKTKRYHISTPIFLLFLVPFLLVSLTSCEKPKVKEKPILILSFKKNLHIYSGSTKVKNLKRNKYLNTMVWRIKKLLSSISTNRKSRIN